MPRTIRSFGDAGQDREIDELHKRIDALGAAPAAVAAPAVQIIQRTISQAQGMRSVTADYTATDADWWLFVDATAANVAVTLPLSAGGTHSLGVIKTDVSGHTVTVTRAGSDTINGASTKVISAQYEAYAFVPDGGLAWGVF